MLPEISRRCLSCGAAVRAGARFCPQCGKVVAEDAAPTPTAEESREEDAPREWVTPTREFSAFVEELEFDKPRGEIAASAASDEAPADVRATEVRDDVALATPALRAHDAEGVGDVAGNTNIAGNVNNAGVVAGASEVSGVAAAAGAGRVAQVREGARVRAERIRNDARVALGETTDDAGLRFVVVAVAVFVLFLFLLFLSTTVLK